MYKLAAVLCLCVVAFALDAEDTQEPPFLSTASADVKADFQKLATSFQDGSLTEHKEDEVVSAWVKKQSPAIQKAYADFQKQEDSEDTKQKAAYDEIRAKLTPAAQLVHDKFVKIILNLDIAEKAKAEQLDALLKETEQKLPAVHAELLKFAPQQ